VSLRAVLDTVVKRKIPSPRRESNTRTPIFQPGIDSTLFSRHWTSLYCQIHGEGEDRT